MNRKDWTLLTPSSGSLDLSNNVCYDKFINLDIFYNRINYPDDGLSYYHLSQHYNLNPKNIAIGYGSSELLLRIFNLFRSKTISIKAPTWQLAELYATNLGMKISDDGDVLYIANPNGLNGKVLLKEEILSLLNKYEIVIVDEAYGDFSTESVATIAPSVENLIVSKTLSKTVAAPGLRFGFCFANEMLIKQIQDQRPGYVTFSHTADALQQLLPQIEYHIQRMLATRNYIEQKYNVLPSQGNYVLFLDDPMLPVKMKKIDSFYRMSLTDLDTFKELENANR